MDMIEELHSAHIPASPPNLHTGGEDFSFSGLRVVKKTAVLLDGGFVRKRFAQSVGRRMAAPEVRLLAQGLLDRFAEELFRVYFYDCSPSDVETTHPISGRPLSLKTTRTFRENIAFQNALAQNEHVALRRGELVFRGWRLTPSATLDLIQNGPRALRNDDVEMNLTQKGVDMKIGLDVAWLATKRLVHRIVLCTGDRDFVPAMKLARREGVQVVLASLGTTPHPALLEHADFVRRQTPAVDTGCPDRSLAPLASP
jgi:uncharacterized LabA/DUF88 family protein